MQCQDLFLQRENSKSLRFLISFSTNKLPLVTKFTRDSSSLIFENAVKKQVSFLDR